MQHHINCQTSKNSASPLNQHLSILAKIRGNTRNGYIPGEVDAMGQNTLKNHNALFWINPFAWPREHTHTKKKEQRIRNFKHTRENDDNNNNDPFEKNNLQNCTRRGFSCTFLPSNVPNQNQPKHELHRTIRKTIRKHEPIEFTEANNKSLPQHHLQLTSTRHNTSALNKLIRFVVSFGHHVHRQRTCRCHTERKTA